MHVAEAQFISSGLKVGAQIASISTNVDGLSYSSIIGFHGGGYLKVKSPLKFGGKIEVLYAKRGADLTSDIAGTNETVSSEFRSEYIDIPLLLTFNIIKPLSLEIGPQMSILTSGETRTNGTVEKYNPRIDPEFGLTFGADFNLPKKLGVYARYNFGFNRFENSDGTKNRITQRWLQLGLKYRILEPI
jgi:hypothetical protein